jgi:hypothetical protein
LTRRAGLFGAASLLALALCAPGCDLVDSLTPFGVGHQDYSTSGISANVNGVWTGATASGGEVSFQVGTNVVTQLSVQHIEDGCTLTFEVTSMQEPVVDGAFTHEFKAAQGRVVVSGRFTSSSTASGTYSFEGFPTGDCPTSGRGTFAAEKTP